ncbi:chitosanase [Desulfovibrio mangrovi]|uniref:VgrG-related protein n=1 Tax=Desulfovibrio mangrovi TaxID=2976983 RepID=UPI0022462F40|nr:chitosanase [Desulfovibrio mangrovi]UZP66337.1 chitosanase [Desulfovibrio mangrovi]
MNVNPLAMGQITSYIDRLKQGGGQSGGNPFGLNKLNKTVGSRFDELLNDPMVQMGNGDAVQSFLGIGAGKNAGDMSALESAMFGSMNLTNVKALATLTKVLGDESNPFASMFRTMRAPEGDAIRMAVTSPQISLADKAGPLGQVEAALGRMQAEVAAVEKGNADATATGGGGNTVGTAAQSVGATHRQTESFRPGALAALFESGADGGISAIGYDRRGGTSYGKYQLSSRAGTMDAFIRYLDGQAPDIASQLKKAGRANTGSRFGAMPTAWKQVAQTQPERFEALQDKFVHSNHFSPAFRAISKAMQLDSMPQALQEVLFSTAVQHGPTGAVRIFAKAFGRTGGYEEGKEAAFIRNVYSIRQRQFTSSTNSVQTAVQGRLGDELRMALSMLERGDIA